ncbi:hypothetical protein L596_010412 [Steinernema carpocapsae]|uniref:Uncharacterized protein n=1 Tax=Steinernema carpocapsae TaxID=34508 RepID=A0A4U5PIB2_STECR|nr:hypothetical protein L596_010412 [Steinernema carpocapsae]
MIKGECKDKIDVSLDFLRDRRVCPLPKKTTRIFNGRTAAYAIDVPKRRFGIIRFFEIDDSSSIKHPLSGFVAFSLYRMWSPDRVI